MQDQHTALEQGRPEDVVAFTPSAGLGPLPPSLAGRARALALELDRLAVDLTVMTAAHARQMQVLSALRPVPARPSFVDARG